MGATPSHHAVCAPVSMRHVCRFMFLSFPLSRLVPGSCSHSPIWRCQLLFSVNLRRPGRGKNTELSQLAYHEESLGLLFCVVWWCVVVCGVWCGTLEEPRVSTQHVSMCAFKMSPCVPAPRAHMLKHMCAWCRYKRGGFERTHGDVFHR